MTQAPRDQRAGLHILETHQLRDPNVAAHYLDIVGVIVLVLDSDGKIEFINRKGRNLLGASDDAAILGKSWIDSFIPERLRPELRKAFRRLFDGTDPGMEYFENPVLTENGEERIIAWHNTHLVDQAGVIVATLSSGEDITERRLVEKRLQAANEKLTTIFDSVVEGIFVVAADSGRFIDVNIAGCRMFGCTKDDVIGSDIGMLSSGKPPYTLDAAMDVISRVEPGLPQLLEWQCRRKDGHLFWSDISMRQVSYGDRPVILASVRDVSARKFAQEQARAATERLTTTQKFLLGIVSSSNDAMISKSLGGIVMTWNDAAERIFGYSADEMIGRPISVLAVPGREDDMARVLEKIRGGERVDHYETRRRRKDGSIVDVSLTVSPIYDSEGTIIGASKIARDVTSAKANQAALRRSQEHLAQAQHLAQMGSVEIDAATRMVTISDELYSLFGIERDTAASGFAPFLAAIHPDDRERMIDLGLKGLDGVEVEPFRFRVIRPDGEIRWFQRGAGIERDSEGRPSRLLIINQDITELRAAELAIRRSEEHLVRVQNVANIGSAEIDLRTRETYWSDGFYRLLGLAPGSVIPGPEQVLSRIHPDDHAESQQAAERLLAGERIEPSEIRIVRADGAVRWLQNRSEILCDEAGVPASCVATYVDITERKEAEKIQLQMRRQLEQAQKMESIGQLTGGMAHDFNNLLGVILGNLDFLESRVPAGSEEATFVQKSIKAAIKGADLTRRLLAFARRQPLAPEITNIAQVLEGAGYLFRRLLGENITLYVRPADGLWPVMIDVAQLEAAILNLAVNARDAMSEGGLLSIEARNVSLDEDAQDRNPEASPGDYVVITVSDTGIGMDAETIAKAFDPFFTTKGAQGSGLGLSMVHGFVKQSGGHTRIYSEPGLGTTMRLYLPAARGMVPDSDEAAELGLPATGEEIILVVEDNDGLREIAVRRLNELGYRTIAAKNGLEGESIIRGGIPIDLLFTDVVMPEGMDGRMLAESARRMRPSLKVLFTSGFTPAAASASITENFGSNFLSKPYRKEDLARAVRAALDSPA